MSTDVRAELMRGAPDSELGARVDEINAVPSADVERMMKAPRTDRGLKLLNDAEAAVPGLADRQDEVLRRAAAIASLAGSDAVDRIHIAEALSYDDRIVANDALIGKARTIAANLKPGEPEIGDGWSWRQHSLLGNDVPKGGMVLDMTTPEGAREFVFDKHRQFVAGPLGRAADREAVARETPPEAGRNGPPANEGDRAGAVQPGDAGGAQNASKAPTPTRPPSTDVSPEQFKQVWQSKPFKEAVAAMTVRGKEGMPHRESAVAEAMVRGWIDGQKGDLEQLRAAALEGEGQFRPNGYNPRQGYIEAYYAAATGEPREIRAIGNDRTMGVREALAELDKEAPALDRGAETDPAIAEKNRQLTELGAEAPLRAAGDVAQKGEIGLGLFDHADQPELTYRLGDEGGEISAADLLKDLEDDDKAIKSIKDCL